MQRRLALAAAVVLAAGQASGQQLRIFHIDVDQGDSTLFVAPGGKTLLVDSGRNGHGPRIESVMASANVADIDFYVTTHYHADHYGGIDDLVDAGVAVREAYDRGDKQFLPPDKKRQQTYRDYERAVGEDATTLRRGMTIDLDPTMTVTAISHGGVVIGQRGPSRSTSENDMSISLLVTYADFRYFVGGDLEEDVEDEIAEHDLVLDVDVYQANHHGSHTSSSRAFLNDLSPGVVVISNGDDGRYQHPRQEMLDRLAGLTPAPVVFQTNRYTRGDAGGNVPREFIADYNPDGDEGTILVTVDGEEGAYTVTYGTALHRFTIKDRRLGASETVVIESLLPNPVGTDAEFERVAIRNAGSADVSLVGWILRDRSGGTWDLTPLGVLSPAQSVEVQRNGTMSLNNAGDEISLVNAVNVLVDEFEYERSSEGVAIYTGH